MLQFIQSFSFAVDRISMRDTRHDFRYFISFYQHLRNETLHHFVYPRFARRLPRLPSLYLPYQLQLNTAYVSHLAPIRASVHTSIYGMDTSLFIT